MGRDEGTGAFEVELTIGGMSCAACTRAVEQSLARVPAVQKVTVNLALERAFVQLKAPVAASELVAAVTNAGYTVPSETLKLAVDGLSEAPLRERMARVFAAHSGVVSHRSNLATGEVTVRYVKGLTSSARIVDDLQAAGFWIRHPLKQEPPSERDEARHRWLMSLAGTVPLWVVMVSHALHHPVGWLSPRWVPLVLGSWVQWGPGLPFVMRAYNGIKHGSFSMDVLVAVATLSAWMMSVYGFWAHGPLYFDMAATVITLVLWGKYWEASAKRRTSEALRALAGLTPQMAWRVGDNDTLERVPLLALNRGDVVVVRPGDPIPVDGVVVAGHAAVDESMLTGEAQVRVKAPGETVHAGTVHRGRAVVRVRADQVGADTLVAQMIEAVEQAQADKAPLERMADRLAARFVPFVMALSVATWAATGNWVRAVAVLVAACPCALGLATPTAILVGTGLAARRGILFRRGEALEQASRVNVLVLDKTGTLTRGEPEVIAVHAFGSYDRATVCALAASLEQYSNHPMGRAFRLLTDQRLSVDDVYEEIGEGLVGEWEAKPVALGNWRLMERLAVAPLSELPARGQSIWLAVEGQIVAQFDMTDGVRPRAKATVEQLKRSGYRVMMATGDHRDQAQRVADAVGITEVYAELTPDAKAEVVRSLIRQGFTVAMVGDGINDALALATAQVGIQVARDHNLATEVADIVLLRSDVEAIGDALWVSRRTVRKIYQNFGWALIYNGILLPLAVIGAVHPGLAGGAMAFSSGAVVTNSLLLGKETRRV
jgi:Cu+-exporting ATPase